MYGKHLPAKTYEEFVVMQKNGFKKNVTSDYV